LLAALSFTLIIFGKSALAAGFGAGFSAGASATATVSAFGGTDAGFAFLGAGSDFSVLTGVTDAVFEGTVFLLQLFISIPEPNSATTNTFLIIEIILVNKTKNYADEFALCPVAFRVVHSE
jgi:hypothetical protein